MHVKFICFATRILSILYIYIYISVYVVSQISTGDCKRRPILLGVGTLALSLFPLSSLLAEGNQISIRLYSDFCVINCLALFLYVCISVIHRNASEVRCFCGRIRWIFILLPLRLESKLSCDSNKNRSSKHELGDILLLLVTQMRWSLHELFVFRSLILEGMILHSRTDICNSKTLEWVSYPLINQTSMIWVQWKR